MEELNLQPSGRSGVVWLILAALACIAYAPAQFLPFISDDYVHIQLARGFGGPDGWPDLLRDPLYRCRAVSNVVSYYVDRWFGVQPLAFNLASLMMHILNTALVAALGVWKPVGWRISIPAASFFAVAEGHQEAVIWFAASPELNVFTFVLVAFLCWVQWLQTDRRTVALYAGALFAFLAALFSKESAVAFVGLQAVGILYTDRTRPRDWLAIAPFAAMSAVYFLLAWSARSTHLHFNDGTFSLSAPFWITLPNSLLRMLWIWGVAALVVLWRFRRRASVLPVLGIALLWAVVTLFPYSFLTYMPRVPSRHTYLASLGLALLVGAAAAVLYTELWPRRRAVLATLAAAVIVHNVGYLWTRKQHQFRERARITTELVELAKKTGGPILVECFPRALAIAEQAVELEAKQPKERLIFRNPSGCTTWRYTALEEGSAAAGN
jgi:hypothetical protein